MSRGQIIGQKNIVVATVLCMSITAPGIPFYLIFLCLHDLSTMTYQFAYGQIEDQGLQLPCRVAPCEIFDAKHRSLFSRLPK